MTHKIRRQTLEIELPREAKAVDAARQAARLVEEQVMPRLDALFSRLAPAGRHVRIGRLEVDLGQISEAGWEAVFVESCFKKIAQSVEDQLFTVGTDGELAVRSETPAARAEAVFFFFLKNGRLPWEASGQSLKLLEAEVFEILKKGSPAFFENRKALFLKEKGAVERLFWQFAPAFSLAVIEAALGCPAGWMEHVLQVRQSQFGRSVRPEELPKIGRALLEMDARSPGIFKKNLPEPAFLARIFGEMLTGESPGPASLFFEKTGGNPAASFFEKTGAEADPVFFKKEKKGAEADQSDNRKRPLEADFFDGILVENCGLVLLAPFLTAFFENLGLLENKVFKNSEAAEKAVHLLHFLATGTECAEEPSLVLPKTLCGLPPETPVQALLELTEAEKTEATDLLKAVIQHWPALKNTGPDGLRGGFLARKGLLAWQENRQAWVLRPERQGQDLLLERLPWGFSVVKLPWMGAMIQCEWGL